MTMFYIIICWNHFVLMFHLIQQNKKNYNIETLSVCSIPLHTHISFFMIFLFIECYRFSISFFLCSLCCQIPRRLCTGNAIKINKWVEHRHKQPPRTKLLKIYYFIYVDRMNVLGFPYCWRSSTFIYFTIISMTFKGTFLNWNI